ncbi:MAG: S-layer homology domain-containing protein [Clostridiales Family XIII bacterium]|jgi:hypothetical protein|nr:S-layer homology domain-containing protein [Clostridiales Family XIII bacterium]
MFHMTMKGIVGGRPRQIFFGRPLALLLAAAMVLALAPAPAGAYAAPTGGYGPNGKFLAPISEDPPAGATPIRTREELRGMGNEYKAYYLANDIDLAGENWIPIAAGYTLGFSGSLDGRGHVIRNMTITGDVASAGLFAAIGDGTYGHIKNLGLENVRIDITTSASSVYVGGITGSFIHGTQYSPATVLSNCYVTGSISVAPAAGEHSLAGGVHAGGLTGDSSGDIEDCYNESGISVTTRGYASAGGVAGEAKGISGCANRGDVSIAVAPDAPVKFYHLSAGGMAGTGDSFADCLNEGAVSVTGPGSATGFAGGIAGNSDAAFLRCGNYGAVTADSPDEAPLAYAGGMVGYTEGTPTIAESLNKGAVSGKSRAGGLAAADANVENSYSSGSVSGGLAGGIIGTINPYAASRGAINAYISGNVTGVTSAGGIVGGLSARDPDVRISAVSGCAVLAGSIGATGAGGAALLVGGDTESGEGVLPRFGNYALSGIGGSAYNDAYGNVSGEDALTQAFYEDTLGWDFGTVWKMPAGGGYPLLWWEPDDGAAPEQKHVRVLGAQSGPLAPGATDSVSYAVESKGVPQYGSPNRLELTGTLDGQLQGLRWGAGESKDITSIRGWLTINADGSGILEIELTDGAIAPGTYRLKIAVPDGDGQNPLPDVISNDFTLVIAGSPVIDLSDSGVQDGDSGMGWTYSGGSYRLEDGADVTVVGSGGASIRAEGLSSATVTLRGATNECAAAAPLYVGGSSALTLNLVGDSVLACTGAHPAIAIDGAARLAIRGPGSIAAADGPGSAGIGGGEMLIASGASLTVPSGAGLAIPAGRIVRVFDGGRLVVDGTISNQGTVIPGDGGTIAINGSRQGGLIEGADAGQPAKSGSASASSVEVGAVSLKADTGQGVQYALSLSGSAAPGSLAWGDSRVFSGLSADTDYYVYARSKADSDFKAGAASVSPAVRTGSSGGGTANPPSGGGGGNSGGGGGGGGGAGSTTAAPTVSAGGGDVSLASSLKNGELTLSIPAGKADEIIEGSDGLASIDASGVEGAVAATLPKDALGDFAEAGLAVEISLPQGSVTLDAEAAGSAAAQAGGSAVSVRIEPVAASSLNERQRQAAGDAPVYDVSLTSGGGYITDFGGGRVTIALPYTLKPGEKASGVVIWHLDSQGNIQRMDAMYDVRTKTAIFTTDHLSLYVVAYDEAAAAWSNPFGDVGEGDWFFGDVEYVSAKGLFQGTGETRFSPDLPMTRGMLVTVLGRLHGVDAEAYADSGFGDVAQGRYYAAYIAWARESGIVAGVSDSVFAPDAGITRQELAAITARYAEFSGRSFPVTLQYSAFTDDADISAYARPAVQALFSGGIIGGRPDGAFDPRGGATRAEVAAVLHRFDGKAIAGDL